MPFDASNVPDVWPPVRTVTEDGKPLFCAKDVAEALGYARARDAVSGHCKGGVVLPLPSAGGIQDTVFLPESDVYRLVMRSKLPGAERFQDWVVEEVLPTIRKTGRFEVAHDIPQTHSGALRLAADLAEQNEEQAQQLQLQTRELAAKDEQLEEQRPKVRAFDKLMDSDGLYGMAAAAKAPGRTLTSLPPSRGRTSRLVFSGCLPRSDYSPPLNFEWIPFFKGSIRDEVSEPRLRYPKKIHVTPCK